MTVAYNAEIYDLITPDDVGGDVAWYRGLALAAQGPVLKLGAGTGRIALERACAGVEVVALDSSSEMLTRLTTKLDSLEPRHRHRVTPLQADMQSFRIDREFALVIAPFRAFLHNLTEAAQAACAARVFDHLRPRGKFALNVFHPSLNAMAKQAGHLRGVWRCTRERSLEDGGLLIRSEVNAYDTVTPSGRSARNGRRARRSTSVSGAAAVPRPRRSGARRAGDNVGQSACGAAARGKGRKRGGTILPYLKE